MPGERPKGAEGEGLPRLAGAARETTTMCFDSDFDVITPSHSDLLTDLGLDTRAVRDTLADDRARRCPERETPVQER